MTDDRHLTALHEAGHTYTAWRLGLDVGPVTIQPGKAWTGLARYTHPPLTDEWASLDPEQPYLRWPPAIRQHLDMRATVAAAGDIAEAALAPIHTPYHRGQPLALQALDIAATAPPTRAEEVAFELARLDEHGLSDTEALAKLVHVIYPNDPDTGLRWLCYISAEAQALVFAGADHVFTLTDALLEHGTLSATAARTILETAECSTSI